MARNRVIYQTEGLFVGGTGNAAATTQIKRVQSANYSFDISRQDVNQYGQLARIDSIILDPPTVSDHDWIELGRTVQPGCPLKGSRRLKKEQ